MGAELVLLAAESGDLIKALPVNDMLIGGLLVPPVVALLNQSHWPAPLKGLVALGACLVAAFIAVVLRGPIDVTDWRNTAVVIVIAALGMYALWWKPSRIAPVIEAATSTRPPARHPAG